MGFAGLIWLVNLPYPMVRRPVARVAPLLLLPSFINMDRNYREAIAHVEQADQLVNNATSAADIELGSKRVTEAQTNLDQLPVWFLGYEPTKVCTFMGGCSWRFTFDEFQRARAQVGRMEARIFQEQNAPTALATAEETIESAKTRYEQATDAGQKQTAISDWRFGINESTLIPAQTLAGGQSKTKLQIYQQEFQGVAGWVSCTTQTQTMIAVAQHFLNRADKMAEQGALTVDKWQETIDLYKIGIQRVNQVNAKDPQYLAAQTFLAEYTQKLEQAQTRLKAEQAAVQQFNQAEGQIQTLLSNPNPANQAQLKGEITRIIHWSFD